jgi:hypothetical protein
MSASLTNMRDFIETFRVRVPSVHPCGDDAIHEYFSDMRNAVDDPVEVMRLMDLVRSRTTQELRFLAENYESCGQFKRAYKIRRLADKWAPADD